MDTEEIFQRSEQQNNKNTHLNFTNRQKNLFEELDKAQKNVRLTHLTSETPMDTNEFMSTNKRKRSETKHLQGRESIFKRPEEPLSKCLPLRSAPDFKRNPHKWVKYSLGDVKYEDMSEQSNTSAALSFLRELEERKCKTENAEEREEKVMFKRRNIKPQFQHSAIAKSHVQESKCDEKVIFKGSKIVMPEYVVGQKTKTSKLSKTPKEKTNEKIKEIKLDHLLEDDED